MLAFYLHTINRVAVKYKRKQPSLGRCCHKTGPVLNGCVTLIEQQKVYYDRFVTSHIDTKLRVNGNDTSLRS